MKGIVKNSIFIMIIICLFLMSTTNNTYSKFTYSKEISGQIVTFSSLQTLYDLLSSKSYTLDTNINFSSASSSANGIGLMMRNGTQNNEYPIYYYRGDVADNNVIYGGFCWLIVRTTETGGTKLIYNGKVNTDGSCNNYSGVGGAQATAYYSGAYIQTCEFNLVSNSSPVYAGYMYNDNYNYDLSAVYGRTNYKSHLADNTVDGTTGRHTQNLKDSTIKGVIDTWYGNNIDGKAEESLLEDTVWCNDRSITSTTYTIDNYSTNVVVNYSAYTRLEENTIPVPSLICSRDMDKFTVDSANGNGDLTYPVGLLTADEINMVGNVESMVTTYLAVQNSFYGEWSLSPASFNHGAFSLFHMYYGELTYTDGDLSISGVRPAISLGFNATISGGDGSFQTPYLIG